MEENGSIPDQPFVSPQAATSRKPSLLARIFGIAEPTYVDLRSMRTPAQHWVAKVHYDAWGSPYTKSGGGGPSWGEKALLPKGRTDDFVYRVEWRHKSGPPVRHPEKPRTAFPATEAGE